MKIKLHSGYFAFVIGAILAGGIADAAAPTRPTRASLSVIQQGTKIRDKVASTSLYSQECYDAYFGCMDEFCRGDNESGGSCQCSDENAKHEKSMADIQTRLLNAHALSGIEIEKIEAGAQADIIFSDTGERQYDASGRVITVYKKTDAEKKQDRVARQNEMLKMWSDSYTGDAFGDIDDISGLTGGSLYSAAHEICQFQLPESCADKDYGILRQLYQTDIKNSCAAFANAVNAAGIKADAEIADAQKNVRDARLAAFDKQNEYDRGQCLIEFKKCFVKEEVCGKDWTRCVDSVASENMQNNKARSTANSTISHIAKFKITNSTREMLDSKRNMCESVLDKCMANRDFIWDDFLRDVAPELNVAELNAESKKRQSCMADISNCVMGTACVDQIGNNAGTINMDACLSKNGEIARAACKNVIDPCERMEPKIWDYVLARLHSTAVDRCTEEVKNCILAPAPIGCGANFENCVGVDYEYMHQLCPLEKLVVCKQTFAENNKTFTMDDLDRLLMGFYLNVDNYALENCQNIVESKMIEICDSTTDCNKFASDEVLGTGSIKSQKLDDLYRVTGMISFGNIKVGNGYDVKDNNKKLPVGQIGIEDYMEHVKSRNGSVPNREAIIETIEAELNNIAGTINRTIELIESDQRIGYCINGRDLSQINGRGRSAENTTEARFPNLLHQVKLTIAESALRQANDNYNKKLTEAIANATKDASADIAQYMCQKMAETGGASAGTVAANPATPLTAPYAISYDIAVGLTLEDLMKNGHNQTRISLEQEGMKYKSTFGDTTRETWAVFNRDDRNCHFCTSTIVQSCRTTGSKGLWGLWDSRGQKCETSEPVEKCEDIPM